MSAVTINDLHVVADPAKRLDQAVMMACADADDAQRKLIVRVPDRSPDGLRVLRQNDVARMLMRHGRISEIAVTDGGTIVAALNVTPRRGEVAIWTGWAIGPWHPSDITQRGLGGSETAAVRLAEELAAMGYTVTLYGQFEQEGVVGDILLRDFQTFDPTAPLDALIGFRDATLFDHRPNARFTALWLEDLPGQERLSPERARHIDRVCCVTNWHKQCLQEHYTWIDHAQVAACRNGIVHSWFEGEPAPEREKRVVFSSSPDRGLDVLLELWPQVREQIPDAELISTYSRWYDMCADRFPQGFAHRQRIMELIEQPGVRRVTGGMGQKDLAQLMRSSMVWAHPSWYTAGQMQFHETSCISAMEAQAAGLVVVASDWGALTETVQHGTLIDGDPTDAEGSWRHAFVGAIVQGLTDPDVQQVAQNVGPEMVRDMGWRGAAEQLASMFAPAHNGRWANL